jgi:excisionase family DNA binding protein
MVDKKNLIAIGEAADYLGVSVDTLRRWEKKGKVNTYRSPGGHRYFKTSDLDKVFGKKYERESRKQVRSRQTDQAEKIIDRPVRPVEIPQATPVRIIRQQSFQLASQSILIPPAQSENNQPQPQAVQVRKPGKSFAAVWAVAAAILFSALALGIALFFYWRSSQQILTPIP